jgi:hypothetical protein
LGVDLDTAVGRACFAKHAPMLGEYLRVAVLAEPTKELRRALDIGEQKRHGSGGQTGCRRISAGTS